MYELTALGIQPDNQATIEGRDGRAVQKPSVNARSSSAQTVHDLLLVQASAISQVSFASLLFQNHTYNNYTVMPCNSVDGLGKRRFASVQAVKNDIQRLAKSGKAPWLVRVESDLSVTDMSGNAWGYCHTLNMPTNDTEIVINDLWLEPVQD
jgi:hypothetical protein